MEAYTVEQLQALNLANVPASYNGYPIPLPVEC